MDDIVMYGTDPKTVWEQSVTVLERLANAGFMVNVKKCEFLSSSIKMLGYHVQDGVVKPHFVSL